MSWEPKRRCPRCGQQKYAFGFVRTFCADCREQRDEEQRQYLRDWKKSDHGKAVAKKHADLRQQKRRAAVLLDAAKTRARLKCVSFKVSPGERERLQRVIDEGRCELTGLAFEMNSGRRLFTWNSPSIDRIEPSEGYVDGNLRVVVYALNAGIGPWGEDVYARVARAYLRRRK